MKYITKVYKKHSIIVNKLFNTESFALNATGHLGLPKRRDKKQNPNNIKNDRGGGISTQKGKKEEESSLQKERM